jgi:hypothetical protein
MGIETVEAAAEAKKRATSHAFVAMSCICLMYAGGALAQSGPGGVSPQSADGPPSGPAGSTAEQGAVPGPGGPRPNGAEPRESVAPPLAADAPGPSADPHILDGVWLHDSLLVFQNSTDMFGKKTPFNAAGLKIAKRRVMSYKVGTPYINASSRCLPPGQPWQMDLNFPFHIFQSKDRFDVLFQEYHGYWEISMNAAKAPPAGYMGRSIGHWDGNTLVVETTGFKQDFWLDVNGTPVSKGAKLEERIRKVHTDHWYLEDVFTLDDPTYYTRPWSWVRDYSWRPDMAVTAEYNCELQTGEKDGLDSSLVPEPQD